MNVGKINQLALSPRFHFYTYYPEGILADFVSGIWASDGTPPFREERIVPDGSNVLVFNFGSPIPIDQHQVFKNWRIKRCHESDPYDARQFCLWIVHHVPGHG